MTATDAPEPMPAETADERVARQMGMMAELAEIGMEMARELRDRVVAGAPIGPGESDPMLAYSRLARAIRLTLALEARLAEGPLFPRRPRRRRARRRLRRVSCASAATWFGARWRMRSKPRRANAAAGPSASGCMRSSATGWTRARIRCSSGRWSGWPSGYAAISGSPGTRGTGPTPRPGPRRGRRRGARPADERGPGGR